MNYILDGLVVLFYFALVFYLGFRFSGKNSTSQDFFLGKHHIHWFWLLASLVATETSSLTFLSIPALAMKSDFSFLQIALGYIIGRTFVALYLLPRYYSEKMVSVYSFLGETFGTPSQKTMSLVFSFSRILGDGIRLYVTSLPIAFLLVGFGFLEFSEKELGILALFLLAVATTVYSVYGGFKAIVFTDTLQLFIYLAGGLLSFAILAFQVNDQSILGLWSKWESQARLGKLTVFHWEWKGLLQDPYYFVYAILGGVFLSIGTHGTDLMLVQRVVASQTLKEGQKILIFSGIFVFLQFVLFLLIGNLLGIFYEGSEIPPDKAFSHFITKEIPSPILGFLLAAILASAMSTLSSTINSLSLTWSEDWGLGRFISAQGLSAIFGVLLFLASLIPFALSSTWEASLLEAGLTIFSFTLGPSLALFLLAVQKKKYPQYTGLVPISLVLSVALLVFLQKSNPVPFTWLLPLGALTFLGLFFGGLSLFAFLKISPALPKESK